MTPIQTYLDALQNKLATGQSTEHTHRPALQALLDALDPHITAINEPTHRSDCGAPDFVILRKKGQLHAGHVEAKDIGVSLSDTAKSEQLKRYRKYLPNLILTDYADFWWYRDGDRIETASLGTVNEATGKINSSPAKQKAVLELLTAFLEQSPEPINKAKALAQKLARLTHMIRDIVVESFRIKKASHTLKDLREALAQQLMPALVEDDNTAQFADLFAQTLAYGLFAAACNHYQQQLHASPKEPFTLGNAARDIPKTNPLLRRLFDEINSTDFEDEPYAGFVKEIVAVLSNTAIGVVLEDFGKSAARQDPILHFYETFLATYDPDLRERRGVYYTPEPVVGYIVRSVDHLLKTKFKIKQGLADETMIDSGTLLAPEKIHKTLILDPAVGTGTFLYEVVRRIRDDFVKKKNAGMWTQYVHDHLLPRLHGFELLMAPYAMAHLKLGMQLAGQDMAPDKASLFKYGNPDDSRLRVFLTNTLEQAEKHVQMGMGRLQRTIGEEAEQASKVKRDLPILVVLGNPPYSGISSNNDPWIDRLLKGINAEGNLDADKSYFHVNGEPLGERKTWLQDDYVKFIRWAQWRLEQTGHGVLAFITNHGYLDNPTFRGMRWSLMQAFDDIYILDLHGNAKKKEVSPDGSPDQNVFDIQQGVAIGIFVKTGDKTKEGQPATVHHAELWGDRKTKYKVLDKLNVKTTKWKKITIAEPFYLFTDVDKSEVGDYQRWESVNTLMPINVTGIVTARDGFVIDHDPSELVHRMTSFLDLSASDSEIQERHHLKENYAWRVKDARNDLRHETKDTDLGEYIQSILYRPFDKRSIFWHKSVVFRMRTQSMPHMLAGENLSFGTTRSVEIGSGFAHIFASRSIIQHHTVSLKEVNYQFPIYLYPDIGKADKSPMFQHWPEGKGGRRPNLDPGFVETLEEETGLGFVTDGRGDCKKDFGPEDVLAYIYAVFHWPEYRRRFEPMLKLDFPRVPTPAQGYKVLGKRRKKSAPADFFKRLVPLGHKLLAAHLLEDDTLDGSTVSYPASGDNVVAKGYPTYVPPHDNEDAAKVVKKAKDRLSAHEKLGRVYISPGQFFEGVEPAVWAFQIGGYQVCEKWLKDRRGRALSYDDLTHYRRVVESLRETISLMAEVETAAAG